MTKCNRLTLPDVWRTCNKIRAAIFRVKLDLWDFFKPYDDHNTGFISENQFISTMSGCLRHSIGLSKQEIEELADYFKIQDGTIAYGQLCQVITSSVPHFSSNKNLTTGLEFEDPLHQNALGQTEERRIKLLLTKMAASVRMRQLLLRPYFQDYELVSKNCGTITICHFARILYFLQLQVSADDFHLLVKKYSKENYTISYNSFLAHLDEIMRYWEENGITDLGGDLLPQFPGRLINAELPKLPRPEIGRIPASQIFGQQSIFHPVLSLPPPQDGLKNVILRIQRYVLTNGVRTTEYFKDFDPLNTGKVTVPQFRRGLDSLGLESYHRLYLSEPELWQVSVFYRDPNDSHRVCWRTFADDIDQVFTLKELEKWPDVRVTSKREVEELTRRGQTDWHEVKITDRDACEDVLEKLKQRTTQRRINLKPSFKDYDRNNNGHVTRAQYRQSLKVNGILLSEEDQFTLEQRYLDDMGFNYFWFLKEVESSKIKEPLYNDYLKKRKLVNQQRPDVDPCHSERDIVLILAKIKAKTVRERIRVCEFLQEYDPMKSGVMNRNDFIRALDRCRFDLTKVELETLLEVFAAPVRKEQVNWTRFVEYIEESFAQGCLEKTPLVVPIQHLPSECTERNFLNFEERQLLTMAMDKLAAKPNMNLESLFQDFDRTNCGTISKAQFVKALSTRGMCCLISPLQMDVLTKAFGFLRGLRDEVDYRAFSKALNIIYINSKSKPV